MKRILLALLGFMATAGLCMAESGHWEQEGVASVGQAVHCESLSAASAFLHPGSMVRITNPETGDEIKATIKKWIPPSANRIIDLSPALAEALGGLSCGEIVIVMTSYLPLPSPCPPPRQDSDADIAALEEGLDTEIVAVDEEPDAGVAVIWEEQGACVVGMDKEPDAEIAEMDEEPDAESAAVEEEPDAGIAAIEEPAAEIAATEPGPHIRAAIEIDDSYLVAARKTAGRAEYEMVELRETAELAICEEDLAVLAASLYKQAENLSGRAELLSSHARYFEAMAEGLVP
jgi:hypothetical protein